MKLQIPQNAIADFVGPWACEQSYLSAFVNQLRQALEFPPHTLRTKLAAIEAGAIPVMDPEDPYDAPLYRRTDTGVALVDVTGPLTKRATWFQRYFGGTSTQRARTSIDFALEDPQVSSIFVVADTPGGMQAGTAELANTIRKASDLKTTWTYAEDLAASAGLWAIAGGSQVFANAGAIIGSIGTYLVVMDQSRAYADAGIEVHVISSAPPIKGAGVPGSKIVPAQIAAWTKTVKDMTEIFVQSLADLRGLGIDQVRALATGDIWGAEEAKSYGLIDGVLSLDEAITAISKEKSPMTKTIAVSGPAASAPALAAPAAAAPAPAPAAAAATPAAEATPPAGDPSAATTPPPAAAAPATPTPTAESPELVELRTRLEAETAARVAAEGRASALERENRTKRFARVVTELGLPTALASVLDRVEATMGAEVFSALETAFKAKKNQDPSLFVEHGTADIAAATEGATGAYAQLQAIAKQLVADKKASDMYTALGMAALQNPGLAAQTRPSGS